MLRLAGQGKPLPVVNDQHCTPSYTADVATAAATLIANDRYGLYHVTNSGATTWYEMAKTVFELANVKADVTPIPSSGYPRPARRPGYSVLALDALAPALSPAEAQPRRPRNPSASPFWAPARPRRPLNGRDRAISSRSATTSS